MIKVPLVVPAADLKMLREDLCQAQATLLRLRGFAATDGHHMDRLQNLIDQIDWFRPLAPDGKHGDLHTTVCGCEGHR